MRRKNYDWDEQNEQWGDYGDNDGAFEFSSVDQNSWNLCSNCDHCNLGKDGISGVCSLDGHHVQYNTACDYNLKKGTTNAVQMET